MKRREAWAQLTDLAESNDPETLRRLGVWLEEKSAEIRPEEAKGQFVPCAEASAGTGAARSGL